MLWAGCLAGCAASRVPRAPLPARPEFSAAESFDAVRRAVPGGAEIGAGAAVAAPATLDLTPPGASALPLEDLVNRALEANRNLLGSRDDVVSSGYSLASAHAPFALRIFPSTAASVSDGDDAYGLGVALEKRFEHGTFVGVAPNIELFGDDYTTAIDTTLRQPLLRGRDREFVLSGINAAEFSARSAHRSLFAAQVDTVLNTVSASYQVVRQRELLRLNEDSARRLTGHAEAARARERAGLASSLDVYRATLQHNRALDSLQSARQAHADALDDLRVQLALGLGAPLDVDAPLSYEWVELDEALAVELALSNRIELRQAQDALRESQRRQRVARHGTEPDLDLLFSWSRFGTDPEFDRSLEFDDSAFSVTLVTTTDVARVREFARYGQTQLDVKAAKRSLAFQRDNVVRQVRRELRDLERAKKRILLQEDQIKQSEGKLELARLKFNHGLASNFDVVEAEGELRSAQTSLVSAVIDYIVGTYQMRAVLGTLLEAPTEITVPAFATPEVPT